MDSREYIRLQRLPYRERLERQYENVQEALRQGSLLGREANSSIGAEMRYRTADEDEDTYRDVLNFGSNSYLGLSTHPHVRKRVCAAVDSLGVGTGGSPAFSGYSREHRALEKRLATLAGHEDAVLLPSGFMANLCWVAGLMNTQDILLYDKHSHASIISAVKMAGVRFFPFDPNDIPGFERLLDSVESNAGHNAQIFSTVEGIRSIDGSVIDLPRWIDVCRKRGVITVLDDAHGLCTLGRTGKGTLEHFECMGRVDFRMSTCSKGLGAQGAFVSGDSKGIFYMRTNANPYVFTTSLAYPSLAAIGAALDVLESEPELLSTLHANVDYLRRELEDLGLQVGFSPGGIVPVYLPNGVARRFNKRLFESGLFAHVMEYPMVPPGLERLRLSVMATHRFEDLERAVAIIRGAASELGILDKEAAQ